MIDVLRASTSMTTALANGCAAVVPAAGPDAARRRAAEYPPGAALTAGEWRGEPLPGFDFGNSPIEFTEERVRGKTVIFTTSNGTGALLAARRAAAVGVAGLVNLSAAAAWVVAERRDVVALCAGDGGARSLEDEVCAGLLVERVAAAVPGAIRSAAADAVAGEARRFGADPGRLAGAAPWARRLLRTGRGADVAACLALDAFTLVPRYLRDVDKVVRGPR